MAAPGGSSGTVSSVVKANAGSAQDKLIIEAVHILGVPSAAGNTVLEAAKLPTVRVNSKVVPAGYDAAGVVKVTGLSLRVGEPISVSWSL